MSDKFFGTFSRLIAAAQRWRCPKARACRRVGVALLGAMLTVPSYAADFWQIYQLALENDAAYRAAEARYAAAKLNLPLARSRLLPSINLSGAQAEQRVDDVDTDESRRGDSNELSLGLEWTLYDQSEWIATRQAKLGVQRAEWVYAEAQYDLTLRVAEHYFNLLAALDGQEVAALHKIAIQRQMNLATQRLAVGLGTRTDLLDAKARFQQADADVIQAQSLVDNAAQALQEIIGEPPPALAGLKDAAPLQLPQPNDLANWVDKAESNNLQLKAETAALNIAAKEIQRQRAARLPRVAINASQRWTETDGNLSTATATVTDTTTKSVSLNLNLPLFAGGALGARTRQAKQDYAAAQHQHEQIRRRVSSETTSAFLAVTNGVSQVNALAEAVLAGDSALQAKQEGFSAGLTTNLDVLDAQRDLSRSRTEHLRARYNYILSVLQLERSAGQLDDSVIKRVNAWLKK